MGASNSKSTGLGNNYALQAYFSQGDRNIPGNYSSVYVEAKLSATNTNWSSSYASYLRIYWHDNRNNEDVFVSELAMYGCSQWSDYYASGTINVTHKDDGTLSGYAYATFTKGGSSSYAPNTGSIATDWTNLDKIDRQSTINSFTGNDIKGNFSATYTAQSSSYENRLRISIPNVKALQTFNNYVSGTNVKLSDSAIQSIKNYTSAKTIVLGGVIETWTGNTKVGESSELTTTCTIKKPARIRINGAWKEAVPYVRINNQWKEATPYTRVNGVWKEES